MGDCFKRGTAWPNKNNNGRDFLHARHTAVPCREHRVLPLFYNGYSLSKQYHPVPSGSGALANAKKNHRGHFE